MAVSELKITISVFPLLKLVLLMTISDLGRHEIVQYRHHAYCSQP